MFAGEIRRGRVQHMRAYTHWKWHLDEVYVKINGEMRYLWRAVDHEGEVLESFCHKGKRQGRGALIHQEGHEAPRSTAHPSSQTDCARTAPPCGRSASPIARKRDAG